MEPGASQTSSDRPRGMGDAGEPGQDRVTEAYKRHIDRATIRENLRRTPDERVRNLQALQRFAEELRQAGEKLRARR